MCWRALNSYVHAGLHPNARLTGGFFEALAQQLVLNSNGLLHLAYRIFPDSGDANGDGASENASSEQLLLAKILRGVHW